MTDVVIGLDVGTSGSKAVAVDPGGTVVASARSSHGIDVPRPGYVEQDAQSVWWEESCALLQQVGAGLGERRVAALAVSGLGPALVPCDAQLRPLRPAILYGIDTRATHVIAELNERLGAERILERGGSVLTSQALGPKIAWLRGHEPDVWRATAGWYTASSFLIAKLTGEYVLDHHTASQCNPLYDLRASTWSRDWVDVVCPDVPMPRLVWPGEIVGQIGAAAAEATGLPVGLPVLGGTVDAWAEAWSVGVRNPGDLMLMYGSTMFLICVAPGAVPADGLWLTQGIEPGSTTLAAGMSTSGLLLSWVAKLTGRTVEDLVTEAATVPAGADGLLMLPYLAGERSPRFDPDARGVLVGMRLTHTPADLMRAAIEAVAFSARHALAAFDGAAPAGSSWRMVAVGGGTASDLWPQIVSDVTGRAQEVPLDVVGAGFGDALLAGEAVGLFRADEIVLPRRTIEPRTELAALYDDRYGMYLSLYDDTRPTIAGLGG